MFTFTFIGNLPKMCFKRDLLCPLSEVTKVLSSVKESQGLEGTLRSSPAPVLMQVPYNRSHREASRQVFNISVGGDSTPSLGSLFPVLPHPYCKEILPHVSRNLPVFKFQAVTPCPIAALH